jgi:hypothetical protein
LLAESLEISPEAEIFGPFVEMFAKEVGKHGKHNFYGAKKQVLSGICTDFLLVKPSFFVE